MFAFAGISAMEPVSLRVRTILLTSCKNHSAGNMRILVL